MLKIELKNGQIKDIELPGTFEEIVKSINHYNQYIRENCCSYEEIGKQITKIYAEYGVYGEHQGKEHNFK